MPHFCGKTHIGRVPRTRIEIVPMLRPHDEIAKIAYSYWQARGGRNGSAEDDWYRAEREWRRRQAETVSQDAHSTGAET
jgi:hypothetical protein